MAYSMLECPKLQNVRTMKFHPEDYDHHVSFRHKNLPSDFDLSIASFETNTRASYSIEAQTSTHKKCPIYVHTIPCQNGDYENKKEKRKKSKTRHKFVLERLEETYWANWKPDKKSLKSKSSKSPEIQIIKSAPDRRRKNKIHPHSHGTLVASDFKIQHIPSKSQEIQTDDIPPVPDETEEDKIKDTILKEEDSNETEKQDSNREEIDNKEKPSSEELINSKFLKHTDSLILSARKQKRGKEQVEQPKCIRLYKKSAKITSKSYIKGGSYPLKSCLKKESNLTKGGIRLGRPGSPLIVSSNYNTKNKLHKR